MPLDHNIIPNNTSTHIYKLNPGDMLMIYPDNNNIYVVVDGILVTHKLFSNTEKFSTGIIYSGSLIENMFQHSKTYNYCYELETLSVCYILSISNYTFSNLSQKSYTIKSNHHHSSYRINLVDLWVHKNIKNRIVQLIMILCEVAGKHCQHYTRIDVKLSYKTIATITGSNRNTVSHIIQQLHKDQIIIYKKHQIIINNILLLKSQTI
uniref:Global nitrogen transcriptional regulator n=1 Tax=Trichogloeopsis pedicellata TaxID=1495610 RepID=A0A1G4P0Y5_9FLOR|nr:Global nitrogen transcriptional regulator [Trichogloeopsis pedicellata]SCW24496.1 Global nitrogen transcriptional regulator [Trichogloeopsis pedicellata]